MIRLFLVLCACLVAGGFVVYQVQQGSGYVLLVWGSTSIEMSVWFALIVVIVLALFILLVFSAVRGSLSGVHRLGKKISRYGTEKAQKQTAEGLVDFIEEDWMPAYKKLTASAKKVPSPIINYLAAARCAYELKKEQDALRLLHEAEKNSENCELAIALTQARMQLSNDQLEQALATLSRADKINPNHQLVLSLKQQLYIALSDWQSLKALLPKLHQNKIGTVKERYYLEQKLYRSLLNESIQKNGSLSSENLSLDKTLSDNLPLDGVSSNNVSSNKRYLAIKDCWNNLPRHFHQDVKILTDYAQELFVLEKHDECADLLSAAIGKEWNDDWAYLYGLLNISDKEAGLKTAEKWLNKKSKNAVVLLTLGRLCLQNKQWGRAKDFFKSSLAIDPKAETYAELGRLQAYLGEEKNSRDAWQQGLLVSIDSLPEIKELDKS